EKHRNSLVVEAIKIINEIKPKVFVFENVRSFMKTLCTDIDGEDKIIEEAIFNNLSDNYNISWKVINFKDYGIPSSRPRTLVIGTKKTEKYMSPLNLFPLKEKNITLREAIGDLALLEEPTYFVPNDPYHFFREYNGYMRDWIKNLKEGESAFGNDGDNKPYKIVKGEKHILKSGHLGNKFRRLFWDKPAACVTTRNDQLAATDTIHPSSDRVLSIRELMRIMTIPNEFKWVKENVEKYNDYEKIKEFLKKNELNIRRCIGEAVPTKIMYKISQNISKMFDYNYFLNNESLSEEKIFSNIYIMSLINEKKNTLSEARESGLFYTPQNIIFDSLNSVTNNEKKIIKILEPSVGGGNFLIPIISKFDYCEKLIIDIVDIDLLVLEETIRQLKKYNLDENKIEIRTHNLDFIDYNFEEEYDYIIGNPPYFKLSSNLKKIYRKKIEFNCDNIFGLFLEKIYNKSENIILILPKTFLMNPEFDTLRTKFENYNIKHLIDYGVHGFKNVFIEIISYYFTKKNIDKIKIENKLESKIYFVPQKYIFHDKMWLMYRNEFFDEFISKLILNVFEFYRDRQITNKDLKLEGKTWVIKSKNILDDTNLINIMGYDRYIDTPEKFQVSKFMNKKCIIMPNFTYNLRAAFLPKDTIVNGSVAIFIPKINLDLDKIDLKLYSTENFRKYYAIVKNKSRFTINIDKNSVYYIGVIK
ncbi:DNA cytosine methyltransferase, partial [Streptobacillus felis]